MDPFTIGFYAIVCAGLSAVAPRVPKLPVRLAVGAAVGVIAATLLPEIKSMIGSSGVLLGYLP